MNIDELREKRKETAITSRREKTVRDTKKYFEVFSICKTYTIDVIQNVIKTIGYKSYTNNDIGYEESFGINIESTITRDMDIDYIKELVETTLIDMIKSKVEEVVDGIGNIENVSVTTLDNKYLCVTISIRWI